MILKIVPGEEEGAVKDDMSSLLEDLFSAPPEAGSGFGLEWQAVFGAGAGGPLLPELNEEDNSQETDSFLPSRLLDTWASAAQGRHCSHEVKLGVKRSYVW